MDKEENGKSEKKKDERKIWLHTNANVGVVEVAVRILIIEVFTLLAIASGCVVLAIVAHASRNSSGRLEYALIEVTTRSVIIALALY